MSGVIDGALGAFVAFSLARPAPPRAPATRSAEPVDASQLLEEKFERRVSALESAVRALEQRRTVQSNLTAVARAATDSADASNGAAAPATNTGAMVDDPLFEAAVRDIFARAEEDRRNERSVLREERFRTRADKYATRLETRLALTPEQKAKIAEITVAHWEALERRSRNESGTPPLTPEVRRDHALRMREEAERKLSQVLDARQMAEYERLGEKMKIGGLGVVRNGKFTR
jgi:hypothetical protein